MIRRSNPDSLYITGLAHEYPKHAVKQEQFKQVIGRLYPDDIASPG
jgi:hypothetical protein